MRADRELVASVIAVRINLADAIAIRRLSKRHDERVSIRTPLLVHVARQFVGNMRSLWVDTRKHALERGGQAHRCGADRDRHRKLLTFYVERLQAAHRAQRLHTLCTGLERVAGFAGPTLVAFAFAPVRPVYLAVAACATGIDGQGLRCTVVCLQTAVHGRVASQTLTAHALK